MIVRRGAIAGHRRAPITIKIPWRTGRRDDAGVNSRLLGAACLGLCVAGGCANGRTVTLADRDVKMPALRADVGFGRGPDRRFGLAAEATGGDADPGPTADVDLLSVQVMARFRPVDTRHFTAAVMAGLELVDFDAEDAGRSPPFDRARTAIGPVVGVDLGWRFVEPVEAYCRGTAGALVESTSSIRGELGLRAELSPHTELFFAYRWWEVEQEDLDILTLSDPPELDIEVEGFVLGMGVRF